MSLGTRERVEIFMLHQELGALCLYVSPTEAKDQTGYLHNCTHKLVGAYNTFFP